MFSDLQDKNYEELKAVSSSYSFHGRAVPKPLAESGISKPEALVTKCKFSLCLPCLRKAAGSKARETMNSSNASEAGGSHVSLPHSPREPCAVEMKSIDENENSATRKTPNVGDIKTHLSPVISTHSPQASNSSLSGDNSLIPCGNPSTRYLEVKPSRERTLSVISEQESVIDTDNHSSNEEEHNGHPGGKSPKVSPGVSPVVSPRLSMASVYRRKTNGNHVINRTEDFTPWKKIRKRISKLTVDPIFDMFITCCILSNTVFLSLEYHGMDLDFKLSLDIGNMVSCCSLNFNFTF